MEILVAGATGSIGLHVVNTAIEMGHQPVALVRNKRKVKSLPRGTGVFYGDGANSPGSGQCPDQRRGKK
ncbi:NAD(P)H-binding protein [Rahnella victoriana]